MGQNTMSDISKPTHTNEDKTKYDAEYERIFGRTITRNMDNGSVYKYRVQNNKIVEIKKVLGPNAYKDEDEYARIVENDLRIIREEVEGGKKRKVQ